MFRRVPLLSAVFVSACAMLLPACSKEEASLLDRAFKNEIRSAEMSMKMEVTGPLGDVAFALRGPFESRGDAFPRFDWKFTGEGEGMEQFQGRAISTGRNLFVQHAGETYEVGEQKLRQFERESRSTDSEIEDIEDAERLGLDLRSWFPESDLEEDSRVGGEATTRVTGELDVSAALKDLRELAEHPGVAGDPSLEGLKGLGSREIDQIDELVSDPRFTVDVAKDDGKLRRVEATMKIRDRPDGPAQTLRFVFSLSAVDEPVEIDAPSGGRPIEELFEQFQAPSAVPDEEVRS